MPSISPTAQHTAWNSVLISVNACLVDEKSGLQWLALGERPAAGQGPVPPGELHHLRVLYFSWPPNGIGGGGAQQAWKLGPKISNVPLIDLLVP